MLLARGLSLLATSRSRRPGHHLMPYETQEILDNLQRVDEIPISSKLHCSSAKVQGSLPLWEDLGTFIRGSIPPLGALSQSVWLRPY